jgi:hypothetical protein
MVNDGTVCTRTAEEISKLPQENQALFAANIVKEKLTKDEVCRLVRLYRSPDASLNLCRMIIGSPAEALSINPGSRRGGKRRANTKTGRLCAAANYAINLLEEICRLACVADYALSGPDEGALEALGRKMKIVDAMITARLVQKSVSPGKQQGGGDID